MPAERTREPHGYPVYPVGTPYDFRSEAKAARWAKVTKGAIRHAVETGTKAGGYWWRFYDMAAEHQPLHRQREKPLRCVETGGRFPSAAAVIGLPTPTPGTPGRRPWNRRYVALLRSIRRGKAFEGFSYKRVK